MREIKFRGYMKDGNGYSEFGIFEVNPPLKESYFKAVVEYIELNDKNGKKYFEGDIAKLPDGSIYHIKSFQDVWYYIGDSDGCLENELKNGEKIGNIFENKELLEK